MASTGTDINPSAFTMARTYCLANLSLNERREIIAQLEMLLAERIPDARYVLFGNAQELSDLRMKQALADLANETASSPVAWLLRTLIILLDFCRRDLTSDRLWSIWSRLRTRVEGLPFTTMQVRPLNCDARRLHIETASADLVVTSPPYINVFNYHQQYRASSESMGWDVLRIARSEIGSNRKHRGNRFLTVIQYCHDVAAALFEMKRVLKPSGRIIIVIGRESTVRKTRYFNGEIVARLAMQCVGLIPETRQERVFRHKFGTLIYEDILHLRPSASTGTIMPEAIANDVLRESLSSVKPEAAADLQEALNRIEEVRPSPLYNPESHHEFANATS
jgi:hypothetical protein